MSDAVPSIGAMAACRSALLLDAPLADRERQYSPSSAIGGDYKPFITQYADLSELAFKAPHQVLRYGRLDRHTIDFFPAASGTYDRPPLLVFIHGGYWQELSRSESAFAALDCVDQGIAFASIDYTLAPAASLQEIVEECRSALRYLHDTETVAFDRTRIFIAGSSAGAHLAACVAQADWRRGGKSDATVTGAILVSGIYALEPLIGTSIDAALKLTPATARQLGPLYGDLRDFPPALIAWGEIETSAFKAQSRSFAAALQAAGGTCGLLEVAERNHFDVIIDLTDPGTLLGAAVSAFIKTGSI